MPESKTKQDLQHFIGMVYYLSNFISGYQRKQPLFKKNAAWYWKEECSPQPTLRYYDVSMPVKISADSSKSGLGAINLQEEQPVAYASSEVQQRYA